MSPRELTPRERVVKAVNFEEPDQVPIDFGGDQTGINREAYERLVRYLGLDEQVEVMHAMGQVARVSEPVLQRFHVDTRYIFPKSPLHEQTEIREVEREDGHLYYECTDEWGIVRHMPVEGGHWFDPVVHPLAEATLADLDHYPCPDARDPSRYRGLREEVKALADTGYAICTGALGTMFEMALYICGFERFLSAVALERPFAERVLDMLLEYWLNLTKGFLKEIGDYIQVINFGDDLGHQQGLLISPENYRELVKPRHKQLFDLVHQLTEAKIWYHCCGAIAPLIPDFIKIGVDLLNPVQVSAVGMDTRKLKAEFGDRIVFWGAGCDSQWVLPFGTPAEVREEVKMRIRHLGPGGGFIFAPVHDVPVETPPENVIAMLETVYEYGRYPIQT